MQIQVLKALPDREDRQSELMIFRDDILGDKGVKLCNKLFFDYG